jgi:hypothetical protein
MNNNFTNASRFDLHKSQQLQDLHQRKKASELIHDSNRATDTYYRTIPNNSTDLSKISKTSLSHGSDQNSAQGRLSNGFKVPHNLNWRPIQQ